MASIDFAKLRQPLSEAEPCGPDLDMEFDDDYMNFVANLEGLMPTTFFSDGQPFSFDPAIVKVDDQIARIVELSARTRDLRLLTLMARLLVLSRDVHGFADAVETIAGLLGDYWEAVNPRAENGAFAMRAATVGTLDEPTVVFSLQYSRLCETRRSGPVTFRAYLYAVREAEPREGEESPTESTLLQALRDSEEQALATRKSLERLRDAIGRIGALWIERVDIMSSPKLSSLGAILTRMIGLIDVAFPREGAVADTGEASDSGQPRVGAVVSAADAVAALAASARYFLQREPSSPVLPLVAQAQQLLGKSFIEVLQTLVPDHVGAAAYQIGGKQFFPLPVERLSVLLPSAPTYGEAAETSGNGYDAEAADSSESSDGGEETLVEETAVDGEATDTGDASSSDEEAASDEQGDVSIAPPPALSAPPPPPARPGVYAATTRGQALGLLDAVASFLRAEEPSSPVPWLIERARALADRDFLSVLRAVLPPAALIDTDQAT